jgi:outer membrane protein OmpA-like peptidoglycan-associated protein
MAHGTASTAHEPAAAGAAGHAAPATDEGWLVPLVLLLATTAASLFALLTPRLESFPPTSTPAPVAAEATPAPEWTGLGAKVDRLLSTGVRIQVPERGVEGRLLAFVQDPTRPADRSTWFDFDRLTFDTGSATLRPSSQDQLAAVAAILTAYPGVKLKLGGYTDDVGDPASNQRLSAQRAATVLDALVRLGVAPHRLEAEGYGAQFPVGDNTTEAGRAMNRRISMRVVEKPAPPELPPR